MYTITLDGLGKNALGAQMLQFLLDQMEAAGEAPVLITGTGDSFSAGLNLKEVASLDGDAMARFLLLLEDAMTRIYLHPAPVVAAVNGHAIAGGCVLALCCDYRVMTPSPRARMGLNEVAIGLRFPPRIFSIVQKRVPAQFLETVVLRGGLVAPPEALRRGLVDELADDVLLVARERMQELATLPHEAYRLTKFDLRNDAESLCVRERQINAINALVPMWTSESIRTKLAAILSR